MNVLEVKDELAGNRVELNNMYAVSIIKKSPMIGIIECGENKTLFADKYSKCDIIVLDKKQS